MSSEVEGLFTFRPRLALLFLPLHKQDCINDQCALAASAQVKLCSHQPEHEMHWQNPRKATERSVLLTCSSNGVIDFRYMGSYVRYPIIIKSINPYTRVTFNHVSIYIMKSSTRVLEGGGKKKDREGWWSLRSSEESEVILKYVHVNP